MNHIPARSHATLYRTPYSYNHYVENTKQDFKFDKFNILIDDDDKKWTGKHLLKNLLHLLKILLKNN